jgi:translation elongation factor EF-Tu-like GTPase
MKKKYKLGNKFPHLRFYSNNQFGEEKNQKSFEIYINNKIESILDEIHEGIDHDVRETSEKIAMNVASSYALEEKKTVVFYFYETGRVSLHIKALSALSILKDDFVFMSVTGPSEDMMKQFQI